MSIRNSIVKWAGLFVVCGLISWFVVSTIQYNLNKEWHTVTIITTFGTPGTFTSAFTLVEFEDGHRTRMLGIHGVPGEQIRIKR